LTGTRAGLLKMVGDIAGLAIVLLIAMIVPSF
jgi:hypothetical protein